MPIRIYGKNKAKEFAKTAKWKIFGKSQYGKFWNELDPQWWYDQRKTDTPNLLIEEDLKRYIISKNNIRTILDVGCGAGAIPSRQKELFSKIHYTGVDISESAITYCKKNLPFEFICGDFIKMEISKQYDLIYSLGVIDHVYDIEKFLTKILKICKKHAYIHSYRGYFPELKNHKQNWNDDEGSYYNDISVKQTKKFLINYGLKENQFTIRPQESDSPDKNLKIQTIIEIEK